MPAKDAGGDWPEIGDIIDNHEGGRPAPTQALVGQALVVRLEDGDRLDLTFSSDARLAWRLGERNVDDQPYEAFAVRVDSYFVDFIETDRPLRSISLWLDLAAGRAILVEGSLEHRDRQIADLLTRVRETGSQSVPRLRLRSGNLVGDGPVAAFQPSSAILGRFLRFRYSDTHLYDHYYASPRYYYWHCWSGPDAGLGDFDEVTLRDLEDELYLVCWTEKALPCLAVTIEDHRAMRSIGKIYGADSRTWAVGNRTVGAEMTLITTIAQP